MTEPKEEPCDRTACVPTVLAAGLLLFVAVATLASPARRNIPPEATRAHVSAVEGFARSGGVPLVRFWGQSPGPYVHPPAVRVLGSLLVLAGARPEWIAAYAGWLFGIGALITAWLWLRKAAGLWAGLFAVALLCGPGEFCIGQFGNIDAAALLMLAPLAMLALAHEKYLACAAATLAALAAHPAGVLVPTAVLIHVLVQRRRLAAGLAAVIVPVLLYVPWGLHVWANGGLAAPLGGTGVTELALPAAVAGIAGVVVALRRGGDAFGPVAVAGAVVAVRLAGYGQGISLHWPLACLGGVALGALPGLARGLARVPAQAAAVALMLAAVTYCPTATIGPAGEMSVECRLAMLPGLATAGASAIPERQADAARPVTPEMRPAHAILCLPALLMIGAMLASLVILDLLPVPWPMLRGAAAVLNIAVLAVCLLPLWPAALGELRATQPDPPAASAPAPGSAIGQ